MELTATTILIAFAGVFLICFMKHSAAVLPLSEFPLAAATA